MKSMVNFETFMLAELEHLSACIIQKSHATAVGCAKSDILSQAQGYCHVHCHSQPGLSGLFLLVAQSNRK